MTSPPSTENAAIVRATGRSGAKAICHSTPGTGRSLVSHGKTGLLPLAPILCSAVMRVVESAAGPRAECPDRVGGREQLGTLRAEQQLSESPWPLSDHSSPRPQSRRSDTQGQIFTRSKKTVRKRVRYRAVVKLEPLGLPNIGNSCFLNATLQCLLFLPMFFREILRQETLWRMCPFSNLLSSLAEVHLSCQPGSGANLASKVKSMWKVMYALMEQEVKYIGGNQQCRMHTSSF
ncbi:hypothetical protein DPEC_G00178100 [Dallia pectoralis]|uniref:Uncharacterized protein n=1 Tax=Dallia pectoralis TaxID=75939 RepID=A0ACC2GFF4_DALPE|nr:hypothetical protein DPEC_G00178100 [Dallia pectoralis]